MSHIPTWVYIIFFVLLYIGIKRCFTRRMPVSRLALAPLIFIFLGVRGTITLFGLEWLTVVLLLVGALFGVLLGYLQVKKRVILADKKRDLIQIPGDVSLLIMLMAIFFIEFFIHYAMAAQWEIISYLGVRMAAMLVSGIIVGISVGRNLTYYRKFVRAESQAL